MLRHGALVLCGFIAISSSTNTAASRPQAGAAPAGPVQHAIIPAPRSIEFRSGDFLIAPGTVITVPPGNEQAAWVGRYLSDLIGIAPGPEPLRVEPKTGAVPRIELALVANAVAGGGEAYELEVVPGTGVVIRANEPAGLFYGVQTLRQLLPPFVEYEAVRADKNRDVRVPAVKITDAPRFGWRGAMLDVSRHFFSVDEVKRYIDLLALNKLNRLHLHLADDQGWRVEIKSWPNLTKRGGSTEVGGGPGGFYTQPQYRDIVAYAQQRFITVVPEIDMPGHTNAALASYAELNCDGKARDLYTGIEVGFSAFCVEKDITYKFIDDVVREIAAMTPGPYFHIGGDEVKTLTAEQYIGFINRVQKIVASHGKQMIGWDEVAPAALLPTTLVQHWRPDGSPAAALAKGAKVIMSVANKSYLDMKYDNDTALGLNWAGNIDVKTSYDWDPATAVKDVPESSIVGVEAPIWSETLATMRDVEFMAFPRLASIAEIGWSRADARTWDEFKGRLGAQAPRWTALGINFYRSPSVPWKD